MPSRGQARDTNFTRKGGRGSQVNKVSSIQANECSSTEISCRDDGGTSPVLEKLVSLTERNPCAVYGLRL